MNFLNSFLTSLRKHHREKHPLEVRAIAAIDEQGGLGYKGKLLYHIPKDLKHFSNHTKGHAVLMGTETYFSLPKKMRPLPNRLNMIITRHPEKFIDEPVVSVQNIQEAISHAENQGYRILWVIGGGQIYTLAMPFIKKIFLTQILAHSTADVFFPEFKENFEKEYESQIFINEKDAIRYRFEIWKNR